MIVGGGVAGLSAGLMLARARRRVVVVDAGAPRNRFTAHMHAVLGHDDKAPDELLAIGRADYERYGGVIVDGRAVAASEVDDGISVTVDDGSTLHARRLIVATGLRDVLPDIEGLAEWWGRGVASCPYCDAWEVRDQRIGIIATDTVGDFQAQLLRQWSPSITYFVEDAEPPASAEFAARGITIEQRRVAKVLSRDGALAGVELVDGDRVDLDAIFTAPRPEPIDELLGPLGAEFDDAGFGPFVVTDPSGKTSVDGVWAAGNVASPMANIPMSMSAGSFAGGAVNADLVGDDIAAALAQS